MNKTLIYGVREADIVNEMVIHLDKWTAGKPDTEAVILETDGYHHLGSKWVELDFRGCHYRGRLVDVDGNCASLVDLKELYLL